MLFLNYYSGWVGTQSGGWPAGWVAGLIENKANSVQFELKLELSLAIEDNCFLVKYLHNKHGCTKDPFN